MFCTMSQCQIFRTISNGCGEVALVGPTPSSIGEVMIRNSKDKISILIPKTIMV